jgi:hypothetical protein
MKNSPVRFFCVSLTLGILAVASISRADNTPAPENNVVTFHEGRAPSTAPDSTQKPGNVQLCAVTKAGELVCGSPRPLAILAPRSAK